MKKTKTKLCNYCKTEIPFNATVCPNCKKKLKTNGCLSLFIIVFVIASIGSCLGGGDKKDHTKNVTTEAESTVDKEFEEVLAKVKQENMPTEENFVACLTKNPDVTKEAAESTYSILKDTLGFGEIKATENLKNTLFEVRADNYNLNITVNDRLYKVLCGTYTLYDEDTVFYTKSDLDDRSLNNNESAYYVIAKEIITNNLKSPSSASFASLGECQMTRNGEYVAVKGYVDAANSFNAMLRNDFVVEFKVIDISKFSYETVYINLNGETSGNYIDLK